MECYLALFIQRLTLLPVNHFGSVEFNGSGREAISASDRDIRESILEHVKQRGSEKTVCPSEVARAIGGAEWRDLMPQIRLVAAELVDEGLIRVTRQGVDVDPYNPGGPIRLSIRLD